jgi:hypothetical protein
MPWKIVAASARGSSHEASGQPCQDAHAYRAGEDWFVGVVCDGAGSARHSDRGARHVADTVVRWLAWFLGAALEEGGGERDPDLDDEAAASLVALAHSWAGGLELEPWPPEPSPRAGPDPSPGGDHPADAEAGRDPADRSEAPVPTPQPPRVGGLDVMLMRVVASAIEAARESVLGLVPDEGVVLADFSATLVGVVARRDGGLMFHIGDGSALALHAASLTTLALSPPENGEFAEQTFFFTGAQWRAHLRFTPLPPAADLIALMSDGAMSFAVATNRSDVDRRFFAPVTKYLLRDDVSPEAGSAALLATLSSSGANRVTHDDKTLLWAHRAPRCEGAETATGEPEHPAG